MHTIIFDIDHTIFEAEQKLHAGVADLLVLLQKLGIQMGAISSHDHRAIVRLDEAGIRGFFDHVSCSDNEQNPKTAEALNKLLKRMDTAAGRTTLVSHAHSDILLGKDARLAKTIGISHGLGNISPLRQAGADHVIPNIPAILDVLE